MGRISKRTHSPSLVVLSNREMVNEYFRLITKKDVQGLVQLFDEDAVV